MTRPNNCSVNRAISRCKRAFRGVAFVNASRRLPWYYPLRSRIARNQDFVSHIISQLTSFRRTAAEDIRPGSNDARGPFARAINRVRFNSGLTGRFTAESSRKYWPRVTDRIDFKRRNIPVIWLRSVPSRL